MRYETTDIKLGAVILSEIPDAYFVGLNGISGHKRVMKIEYPTEHEEALRRAAQDYERKSVVINLYRYNKALSTLRDAVMEAERRTMRDDTMGVQGGRF